MQRRRAASQNAPEVDFTAPCCVLHGCGARSEKARVVIGPTAADGGAGLAVLAEHAAARFARAAELREAASARQQLAVRSREECSDLLVELPSSKEASRAAAALRAVAALPEPPPAGGSWLTAPLALAPLRPPSSAGSDSSGSSSSAGGDGAAACRYLVPAERRPRAARRPPKPAGGWCPFHPLHPVSSSPPAPPPKAPPLKPQRLPLAAAAAAPRPSIDEASALCAADEWDPDDGRCALSSLGTDAALWEDCDEQCRQQLLEAALSDVASSLGVPADAVRVRFRSADAAPAADATALHAVVPLTHSP
eukprot:TRINITY_DN17565_c0_g1_i2.p1 TRINITY_DN17565_c0_g1~~TRINITY_DN17565_c0_g1_i2.p1  ORF type:complete len:327 (+),score=75.47 TRINITY_DN17565_c0_g1_i2:59-982(+)